VMLLVLGAAVAESVLASRYLGTQRDDEAVPPRPALRNTQEVG
jgi:hypothetical protein